mmetsp:Transcript_255/g.516  ORF Transcript_255/g.516 Transcript_255/m.516 type:complete len:104 (-) Transcript_255:592-903(-)
MCGRGDRGPVLGCKGARGKAARSSTSGASNRGEGFEAEGETDRMISDAVGEGGGKVDGALDGRRSDKHHDRVTTSGADARRFEMFTGKDRSDVGRSVLEGPRC